MPFSAESRSKAPFGRRSMCAASGRRRGRGSARTHASHAGSVSHPGVGGGFDLTTSMPGYVRRRRESLVMARARKYPEELLERGTRLVFESGRPIAHVAADLGVPSKTLRRAPATASAQTPARRGASAYPLRSRARAGRWSWGRSGRRGSVGGVHLLTGVGEHRLERPERKPIGWRNAMFSPSRARVGRADPRLAPAGLRSQKRAQTDEPSQTIVSGSCFPSRPFAASPSSPSWSSPRRCSCGGCCARRQVTNRSGVRRDTRDRARGRYRRRLAR